MRSGPPPSGRAIGEDKDDVLRIRINVLGKFKLVRGEIPITEKEWSAAKKPQMFLKALITRGAENVPMDMIIDDLWPDSSPEDGKRNSKVVLHRLRKILGYPASSLSSYVLFEINAASLNRKMVRLDIDEFLDLCKRAREAEQSGDIRNSIDCGKSAIELYKGDYLEDELYTSWTMQKRQETRALYIDVLQRTASLYERQGNSRKSIELYRMLIKADPDREEAYRKLMLLYSRIGMRTEAIRTYDECKRVLHSELGVDPDKLTASIYRRILENDQPAAGVKSFDFNQPNSYTPKYLAEKILTSRSAIEGERKIVTVMFAGVANAVTLFERVDPEVVHEIMDGCFRLLLDAVHRFEGTINQFQSNGVMAIFGAPIAHEDHAQRACRAALAVQAALTPYAERLAQLHGIDFQMRIGLNSGPVVVGSIGNDLRMDYTAQGDTVSLGEAVQNAAGPGEIMVTEHLCKRAREFFEFVATGDIQVEGREESIEAYRLIKPTEIETRFAASVARGLTRFVGRTHEIKTLQEAFDKAGSGEGRVVGIAGEAGVGKSRLLLEFRNSLPKGAYRYLEGRCFHYGKSMPYLPILDLLRSCFGVKEGEQEQIVRQKLEKRILGLDRKLGNILSPLRQLLSLGVEEEACAKLHSLQQRAKTFEAIRDLFLRDSKVRPIILAIEDLHWIDSTTEELLDHMINWIPEARILLILLYRNEYVHQWASKACYREIRVGQLSTSRSMELVAAILHGGYVAPELTELIVGRSEGNPFFTEELIFAMLENGSIRSRGNSFFLSPNVSSVEVPDTIQGVLAARMDRLGENLKRIVQVAAVTGREFAFRILETISERKAELKSGLNDLQKLGYVYRKSLSPELEYTFRHALTREVAYNSLLVQRRKEIHGQVGKAIEQLYPKRLEEFYEMLAWHYSHSGNQDKACLYLRLAGQKSIRSNSYREAFHLFRDALEVLGRMPVTTQSKRSRLDILRALLVTLRPLAYPEGSMELLLEGDSLAKELGDQKALVEFLSQIGVFHLIAGGDSTSGKTYIEKAYSISELIGEVSVIAPIAYELGFFCMVSGDYRRIWKVVPGCLELIEKTGVQSETFGRPFEPYPMLKAQYGFAMGGSGNFDEGERILRECHEWIRTHRISDPYTLAAVELYCGTLYSYKGEGEKVARHFNAAAESCRKSIIYLYGFARAWAGYGYLLLGQPEKALEHMEEGLKFQRDLGVPLWLGGIHAVLAIASLQLGNPGKALIHAEQGVKLSRANKELYFEALAEMLFGKILGDGDPVRFAEGRRHILRGIHTADELQLKPLAAEGRFYIGELSASSGGKKEATEHLRSAEAMFLEMRMDYWLEKTRSALAKL